jgi:hypothetical protein
MTHIQFNEKNNVGRTYQIGKYGDVGVGWAGWVIFHPGFSRSVNLTST